VAEVMMQTTHDHLNIIIKQPEPKPLM